jgi:Beta-lactamase
MRKAAGGSVSTANWQGAKVWRTVGTLALGLLLYFGLPTVAPVPDAKAFAGQPAPAKPAPATPAKESMPAVNPVAPSAALSEAESKAKAAVRQEMIRFIGQSNINAGLLFGSYNERSGEVQILTEGAIEKNDDLRVACPITKPCVAYMVLKHGLNLDSSINRWFPVEKGYTKADTITLRMLLYHTSGIRDFARVVKIDPYRTVTPIETINLAYQNQALDFMPGAKYQYSNTDYNILGTILAQTSHKSFEELIKAYFASVSPTLRVDDGKGKYPRGYSTPWPYHWSTSGYAGGLISTAEDAMKVFSYITKSPEYQQMTEWIKDPEKSNHLVGMGIFAFDNFHEFGRAVYYDGDMMANQMFIIKIGDVIYYFHTTHRVMLEDLIDLSYRVISLVGTQWELRRP